MTEWEKLGEACAITATSVTVEIAELEEDLADATVTVKDAAGKVYAVTPMDLKAGAKTATFNFVTPLTVSPTSAWTVNGVKYVVDKLAIVAVESIDSNNKNLVVEFNSPMKSLEVSEIVIREKVAQTRSGVASVKLAADGMSAQITLVGFGDASVAGLKATTLYTLSITKDGSVISSDFEIPAVTESAVVQVVNSTNRTIQVSAKNAAGLYTGSLTFNIPEKLAFDFQEARGRDLTIWSDKDRNVTKFAYNDETVIYDAIEYETKTINGAPVTVVKTVTDGKTYEISTNVGVQSTNNGALVSTIGNKDNYAKVVIGTDGKAKTIIAHDLGNAILVEKVEGNTVSGYGLAASFKDYTMTKAGKTVTIADLKAGDAIFYNTATKVAEVYNKEVSGTISAFYNNEIQLEGKSYVITNAQGIIDGKFESLTNDNVAAFTNVTAYLDRAGQLELLTGDRSAVESATSVAFAKENVSVFNFKGVDFLKLVTQKADGSAVTEEVDATKLESVKGITVAGKSTFQTANLTAQQIADGNVLKVAGFFIAKDAGTGADKLWYANPGTTIAAAKADVIAAGVNTLATELSIPNILEDALEVSKNKDGIVTGINFLGAGAATTADAKLTDKALTTAGPVAHQLSPSVPVFIKDTLAAGVTTQTYTSTTWGDLDPNISKILKDGTTGLGEFTVYNDGKGNAKYIVINEALIQGPEATTKFEAPIAEIKYGTQSTPEISYIKFAGDDTQYKVASSTGLHTTSLAVGQVLNVETKDADIVTFTQETVGTTNKVGIYSASDSEIADGKFSIAGTTGYSYANTGVKVYEVTGTGLNQKLEERSTGDLANLKSNQYIEASLIAAGSQKVDVVVIRTDANAPIFAATYPKAGAAQAAASQKVELLVKANEAANAYYVVVADGGIAPSATQIKAGQDSTGVAAITSGSSLIVADTEKSFVTAALGANSTAYDIYVVVEDAFGNATSVVKVDVTTPAAV